MEKITAEQIEAWKKQHGEVFCIKESDKLAYLKKPSRKALSYASAIAAKDPMGFNEILLKDCWLGGDEAFKNDDALFLSLGSKLVDLIEIKEVEMVKL